MKTISELHKVMKGTFEVDLGIVHNFSDGLYAKQMFVPKGYVVGTHAHTFSHLSIPAKGLLGGLFERIVQQVLGRRFLH